MACVDKTVFDWLTDEISIGCSLQAGLRELTHFRGAPILASPVKALGRAVKDGDHIAFLQRQLLLL